MDEHLNERIGIKVKREKCELCLAIFMVSSFILLSKFNYLSIDLTMYNVYLPIYLYKILKCLAILMVSFCLSIFLIFLLQPSIY